MKKTIFLLLAFGFALSSVVGQESGVQFQQRLSWNKVLKKAKKEHRYIFVDCYASWCGPCKLMDEKVYPSAVVAKIMNDSFVAYKAQCDTAKNDDQAVKARYADAHAIAQDFKINAYPTFLFFSPEGKLVHEGQGYQDPDEFVTLAKAALDPSSQYFTLVERYKAGEKDYAKIPALAETVEDFGDKALYKVMARDYIVNYLGKLSLQEFLIKKNIGHLLDFSGEIHSDDDVFNRLVQDSNDIDSVWKTKGVSEQVVNEVISHQCVDKPLETAKLTGIAPNWDSIGRVVSMQFGSGHPDVVLGGQMHWYLFKKDTEDYCGNLIERIAVRELKWGISKATMNNLNIAAWEIFSKSKDPEKFSRASSWMGLVVNALTDSTPHAGEYIDTDANLLYRLGKADEAIVLEIRSAALRPRDKEIQENLRKMKAGRRRGDGTSDSPFFRQKKIFNMKLLKTVLCIVIAAGTFWLAGCKKNNDRSTSSVASLNVVNALPTSVPLIPVYGTTGPLTYNFVSGVPKYGTYQDFTMVGSIGYGTNAIVTAVAGSNPWYLVQRNGDTLLNSHGTVSKTMYSGMLTLTGNTTYSLFITGADTTAPDYLFVRDTLPYHSPTDSAVGIRFVNLSTNSQPISINLEGLPNGSEVQSLGYKGITSFKNYTANSAISDYFFVIRDAATGDSLTSFDLSGVNFLDPNNANTVLFENLTIALVGQPVGGTVPQQAILIGNY